MDNLTGIGRLLMFAGGLIFALGVMVTLAGKVPFLGRLPGDILVQRDGVTIFIPIATMILLSLTLTVILNLAARLFR